MVMPFPGEGATSFEKWKVGKILGRGRILQGSMGLGKCLPWWLGWQARWAGQDFPSPPWLGAPAVEAGVGDRWC